MKNATQMPAIIVRLTAHGDGSGQTWPKRIEEEAAPAAEHAAVHEGDVDGLAAAGAAALEQVHGKAPAGVVVGAHVAQADAPQLLSAGAGLDVDRVRRVRAARAHRTRPEPVQKSSWNKFRKAA